MTNTCKHTYDNGGKCNSAAAKNRDYCAYHLRYRARLLRIAQVRARNERFDLKLPPLEDMFAVHSALNQLVEAVAADMIDLKRAHFLLTSLRAAAKFLLARDKWPASIAHSDQPAPDVDLAAEYGLPNDLDLNTPPEVAFPSPASTSEGAPSLSPSSGDRVGTADESNDPLVSALRSDGILGDFEFHPDYPVTPEYVELDEIRRTQGSEASAARSTEMMRNERRRRFRTERKRYAKIAAQINLQRAADKLAERKLAVQKAASEGCPIPPSVGGVGLFPDTTRKPVASAEPGETVATNKEAAIA